MRADHARIENAAPTRGTPLDQEVTLIQLGAIVKVGARGWKLNRASLAIPHFNDQRTGVRR